MTRVLFLAIAIILGAMARGYTFSLDKIKVYFLSGDYKSAISEGEKTLAISGQGYRADELYYLLAITYLKNGNYLRASDIFEIILKEFNNSPFREAALLGLGDTYFLRGDYDGAEVNYRRLISDFPRTKIKAAAYYRLSQCSLKAGNTHEARDYQNRLSRDFPLSPEVRLVTEMIPAGDLYYTVQAGSFLNRTNANNLAQKLKEKGYSVYIEELPLADKTVYRVKVGRFATRQEAMELENKLSREGYPTKVCP
jgi:outer membrane protein assembly factor BamD (BamD/ComL family)